MEFKQRAFKLNNRLSFWNNFKDEERFLFYNPVKKEYVLGAKRCDSSRLEHKNLKFPYRFSTKTYFETIKDEKWSGFEGETCGYEYYFVESHDENNNDSKEQTLYYRNNLVDIMDAETKKTRHVYKTHEDDYDQWSELYNNVSSKIADNYVNKVVISRELKIESSTEINVESIIEGLIRNNPSSYVFAYFKNGKTFLGATPEVIVQKRGSEFSCHALAGTILKDKEDDKHVRKTLLNDKKNRHEHQIVIDAIVNEAKNLTSDIRIDETKILTLKNIHHIQTKIHGYDRKNSLGDWVKMLHPTPALGGNPKNIAMDIIKEYETHERGLYGAPIGLIDKDDNGVFVVGIRSALISGKNVYAYAGAGIVDKSDCMSEYIETDNKFRTIIESL